MNSVAFLRATARGPLGRQIRLFASDEDGSILMFVVVLFLMMVVASGGAVDFMRHEMERARLQDSLDRGVLAAAAFSQDLEAEDTVRAYLVSSRVPGNVNLSVLPNEDAFSRRVDARANYSLRTFFLRIIGINDLTVAAISSAEQARNNIEISVALDITPSMSVNNKMANMKAAAHDFIDTILTEDTKEVTSVTLVPFGGQTNPGEAVFDHFNVARVHDYSTCVAFVDGDFDTVGLSTAAARNQSQHFLFDSNAGPTSWCPDDGAAMVPLSNDADALHQRITDMGMHGWTGIQNGLKWGTIMLDPASRDLVTDLISEGEVPAEFAGRPAAWNTDDTLKFAVIMTDGEITQQYGIRASDYDTPAERDYWATHYLTSRSAQIVQLTSQPRALDQLLRLCAASKAQGIVLFTIGFEVNDTTANTLQTCASSAGHFYRVEGIEISSAFDSIARTIQTVRLVQ